MSLLSCWRRLMACKQALAVRAIYHRTLACAPDDASPHANLETAFISDRNKSAVSSQDPCRGLIASVVCVAKHADDLPADFFGLSKSSRTACARDGGQCRFRSHVRAGYPSGPAISTSSRVMVPISRRRRRRSVRDWRHKPAGPARHRAHAPRPPGHTALRRCCRCGAYACTGPNPQPRLTLALVTTPTPLQTRNPSLTCDWCALTRYSMQ